MLGVLDEHPHSTVSEVRDRAISHLGSLSVQATYDVLSALHERQLIRRIEPAGQTPRYEVADDNHHHLICRRCGALRDVSCHIGHAPCLTPHDAAGYIVDEAEVIYWGTCPACIEDGGEA